MSVGIYQRLKASAVHFAICLIVLTAAALFFFTVLYPGIFAYISGIGNVFLILVLVDLVIGPLITFIVFNTKKKELMRDLVIVVLIQLAALFYGLWVMWSARPVFAVFNIDRFDVVYANELNASSFNPVSDKEYNHMPFWGPKIIGARLPSDTDEANKIIMSAISGEGDLQYMPKYYLSYSSVAVDVIRSAKPITDLRKYNKDREAEVEEVLRRYSSQSDKIGYLPMKGKFHDVTVIVTKNDGEILEFNKLLPIDRSYGVNSLDLKKILKK
jgi:hypothetical protein